MRSPLPPQRPPGPKVYRLEHVQPPKTPQEQAGLAIAYARRDTNRQFRRVLGKIDRIIEDRKKREALRRRFGPRQ